MKHLYSFLNSALHLIVFLSLHDTNYTSTKKFKELRCQNHKRKIAKPMLNNYIHDCINTYD